MKYLTFIFMFSVLICPLSATAENTSTTPEKKCFTGPVNKTYGQAKWLVYSCDDNQSLVFVTAPGSAAEPFYFTLFQDKGKYRMTGEGTGKKEITDAAVIDIQKLTADDIHSLIEQTKSVHKQ